MICNPEQNVMYFYAITNGNGLIIGTYAAKCNHYHNSHKQIQRELLNIITKSSQIWDERINEQT